MKRSAKWISFLLVLVMVLSCLPAQALAEEPLLPDDYEESTDATEGTQESPM